ncbi:MAG: FG-GAP repeat protein [Planctomycetes bacterium]|nr:FG-GAP repeat protein [Planctomycetota bacterium]
MHRTRLAPLTLLTAITAAQNPLLLRTHDGVAATDNLGAAVANVGDLDRDGAGDYAISEPYNDQAGGDAGRVRVFSGRTGAVLWTFTANGGDHLGTGTGSGIGSGAVNGAGDVDADGWPDVIVGAHGNDGGGLDAGRIWVWSGRTGLLIRTHTGAAAGEEFGLAVAGVGDLDADGHADYAGGAPLADGPGVDRGKARIYSGRTGIELFAGQGTREGDHYGQAIAGLGDVDGDGRADFVITAPWSDETASKAGSAIVYSGRTFAVLYTFLGTGLGYEFGTAVARIGDVNGDGRADVLVASPEDKTNGDDAGMVRLFSGVDGSILRTWFGGAAYDYFGHQIGTGDVDGDGIADVIAGAPLDERSGVPTNGGIVQVFSAVTGNLILTIGGNQTSEQLGRAVAGIDDVNGDGFAEILCGAPLRDGVGADAGSARLHCGRPMAPATMVTGVGCPAQRPLRIAYGTPARLGQPLQIRIENGPLGTVPGYLTFGFSRAGFPVSLAGLGLAGCTQYASTDLIAPVVLTGGLGAQTLTLPATLAPCGLAFWNQGVALDATAPGGLAVTDLGRAIIAP